MSRNLNDEKFTNLCEKMEKCDNGSKNNRLKSFFTNLSKKYSMDKEEIIQIGLISLMKISMKSDLNSIKSLEAYVWKTIRCDVLNYIKKEKNKSVTFQYSSKCGRMMTEFCEIDDSYGISDSSFHDIEVKYDVEKLFNRLNGREWRLANLIFLYGNKIKWLCSIMGITENQFNISLDKIKCYLSDGYA